MVTRKQCLKRMQICSRVADAKFQDLPFHLYNSLPGKITQKETIFVSKVRQQRSLNHNLKTLHC